MRFDASPMTGPLKSRGRQSHSALLAPDHRGAADVPIDLAGDRLDRRSRETYCEIAEQRRTEWW
jgi:hypothetical protein